MHESYRVSRKVIAVWNGAALCYRAGVVRIRIRPRGVSLTAHAESRLLDLVDEQSIASVPLSCRGARCGLCLLRVERGANCFHPPGPPELETLRALGAGRHERLGCQLWLLPGAQGEAELLVLSEAAEG